MIKWQSVIVSPKKLFIGNSRLISNENLAEATSLSINALNIKNKINFIQTKIILLVAILLRVVSLLTMKVFCLMLPSFQLLCEARQL